MLGPHAGLITGLLPAFHNCGLSAWPIGGAPRILSLTLTGRAPVFDQPGIGVEDLAGIHRDQFVHYVQPAHALGDPGDWSHFPHDLLRALTAAFGLDAGNGRGLAPRQHRALQVLDEIGRQHDPAANWPTLFDTLWRRRHAIRAHLP